MKDGMYALWVKAAGMYQTPARKEWWVWGVCRYPRSPFWVSMN